ncbi:MAG: DUF835 domain-containing protein [Thermoplasmata archaeon]
MDLTIKLILQIKPRVGLEMLAKKGEGLCISRYHPAYLRNKYVLPGVTIYWLSETKGKDTIHPDNIERIVNVIKKYGKTHKKANILLDGLEYLLLYHNVEQMLDFMNVLDKLAEKLGITLMIHADPQVIYADREIFKIFERYLNQDPMIEHPQIFQAEGSHGVQTVANRGEL